MFEVIVLVVGLIVLFLMALFLMLAIIYVMTG